MKATWRNGIAAGDPVEAVADKVVQAATDKEPSIGTRPENGRPSPPDAALHPREDFRQELPQADGRDRLILRSRYLQAS
jgi:hypothetical protein